VRALILVLLVAACGADATVSRDLGARCSAAADCDDRCLAGDPWPGGLCTRNCVSDRECPSDSICDPDEDACLYSCLDDRDCTFLGDVAGRGWVCRARGGSDAGPGRLTCVGE